MAGGQFYTSKDRCFGLGYLSSLVHLDTVFLEGLGSFERDGNPKGPEHVGDIREVTRRTTRRIGRHMGVWYSGSGLQKST